MGKLFGGEQFRHYQRRDNFELAKLAISVVLFVIVLVRVAFICFEGNQNQPLPFQARDAKDSFESINVSLGISTDLSLKVKESLQISPDPEKPLAMVVRRLPTAFVKQPKGTPEQNLNYSSIKYYLSAPQWATPTEPRYFFTNDKMMYTVMQPKASQSDVLSSTEEELARKSTYFLEYVVGGAVEVDRNSALNILEWPIILDTQVPTKRTHATLKFEGNFEPPLLKTSAYIKSRTENKIMATASPYEPNFEIRDYSGPVRTVEITLSRPLSIGEDLYLRAEWSGIDVNRLNDGDSKLDVNEKGSHTS